MSIIIMTMPSEKMALNHEHIFQEESVCSLGKVIKAAIGCTIGDGESIAKAGVRRLRRKKMADRTGSW